MANPVYDCYSLRPFGNPVCPGKQRLLWKGFWNSSRWVNSSKRKRKEENTDSYTLFLRLILTRKNVFFLSDHALVGHVIQTTVVVDEFECQLNCMGNSSCKSINVRRGDSNGKRSCELNNTTRQMKPGHFKKKKGSTYYSSVQVGSGLSRFVDNFPILFTAKKNVSQLLLYTNENWENQLLYLFYLFWVLTWA